MRKVQPKNITSKYTPEQIDKIGNTIIYLASRISFPTKTKILKLLYILDELSVKKSGLPFLNLSYGVWKFGPVSKDIFIELSSSPSLLRKYIILENEGDHRVVKPLVSFSDDEFSQNDLDLMDLVIKHFGKKTAKELSNYTHRKESLWYKAAVQYNLLEPLINEEISNTNIELDLRDIVRHDERKLAIYEDYTEQF